MFPFGNNNEVCILIYSVTRKVITCILWVYLGFAVDLNILCKKQKLYVHNFFLAESQIGRTLSPIIRGHQHLITAGGLQSTTGVVRYIYGFPIFQLSDVYSDLVLYRSWSCLTEIPKRLAKKHMALFIPWGPGLEYM